MSVDHNKKIQQALQGMLNAKLVEFVDQTLTSEVCAKIYVSMFESVNELVGMVPELKKNLDEQSVNFIAQGYYDLIEVNGQTLDPNVFTKRVKVTELSTRQLALVGLLFVDTPILSEIMVTLKKRS